MNLNDPLELAVETALEAGAMLKAGVESHKTIGRKSSDVDLVTEFDRRSEALIAGKIQARYPDHNIIAEESDWNGSGPKANGFTWYIDPLDGTNNYSHSFPVFAVSIALYQGSKPLVGVVFDPMRDECFQAVNGQGAHLLSNGNTRPLTVSQFHRLVESLLATGFPYDRHHSDHDNVDQFARFLKQALGVRRPGSAALDLAYVAAGRLDGYWEYKLSSWDVAAGLLLVQEAGGRVSRVDGRSLQIAPTLSLVASNGLIHEHMVATLNNPAVPSTADS